MTKKIGLFVFLIFLVLLFFYVNGRTGNIYEKIPVEVYRHSIIVPITIEGKTYSFQLDTGAPTSISQELYFELCLSTIDSVRAEDYYGHRRWVHNSILPEIQIGHTSFSNINVGIVNPIQSFQHCDKKIDGYLGSDFFRDKMLMIDLLGKEIVITDDRSTLPIRRQDAINLTLWGEQLAPMFLIELSEKVNEWVLFDTGSGNHFYHPSLKNFNQMVEDGVMGEEHILDTLYGNSGRGVFGPQQDSINYQVQYDQLKLGRTQFTNVRASTFGGDGRSKIGAPLLKKGTVIVDWKYRHLYFNPYPELSTDFKPKAGFALHYNGDKLYTTSTHPESLSYASGVRDGFILTYLNGIQLDAFGPCDLLNIDWAYEWSKPQVSVKLEHDGQEYCINETKNLYH